MYSDVWGVRNVIYQILFVCAHQHISVRNEFTSFAFGGSCYLNGTSVCYYSSASADRPNVCNSTRECNQLPAAWLTSLLHYCLSACMRHHHAAPFTLTCTRITSMAAVPLSKVRLFISLSKPGGTPGDFLQEQRLSGCDRTGFGRVCVKKVLFWTLWQYWLSPRGWLEAAKYRINQLHKHGTFISTNKRLSESISWRSFHLLGRHRMLSLTV